MRSVRYATASSFIIKITLITALFFFLFSFLLTGLFNLIDFEKSFYERCQTLSILKNKLVTITNLSNTIGTSI